MVWFAYGRQTLKPDASGYDYIPQALSGCCGVGELRGFIQAKASPGSAWCALDSFKQGPYTGIFVCTYTKKQQEEGLEDALNELHTLLYQTDFIINTSPMATDDGRTGGVRTAMYKWGKEGK